MAARTRRTQNQRLGIRRQPIWVLLTIPVGVCHSACHHAPHDTPHARHPPRAAEASAPEPPPWIRRERLSSNSLCGLGIAGAGFGPDSPYPKALSRARAVRNLAGLIRTAAEEAIVDKTTTWGGDQIETARRLTVDDDLIARVDSLAKTATWLDVRGVGPFGQKGFTYAHACIDTNQAGIAFAIDPKTFGRRFSGAPPQPDDAPPTWLRKAGRQPGGRLCAVGFSPPAFFSDATFLRVVDDVRAQLAEVIATRVASYHEERTQGDAQLVQQMTVAMTQAVARGVVVTDYWYDPRGLGPQGQKNAIYGWGCVYPSRILAESFATLQRPGPTSAPASGEAEDDQLAQPEKELRRD